MLQRQGQNLKFMSSELAVEHAYLVLVIGFTIKYLFRFNDFSI